MTLRTRRFILYSLLFVFLAAGTGLVLYAQGWRLDWKTLTPTRVGGIYIRSFPAGAKITLDDKEVRNKSGLIQSGTLINNLFPRSYRLSLAATGFKPLQRNVLVQPSLVTELNKLVLVPETAAPAATSAAKLFLEEPELNATGSARILLPKNIPGKTAKVKRANRTTVGAVQDNGEFYLYRPAEDALIHLTSDVRDFFFSENADKVALLGKRGLEIFSLDGRKYWRFNLEDASKISGLLWYKDGEHIFVQYPEKTKFLDLSDAGLQDFVEVAPSGKSQYDAAMNVFYYLKDGRVFNLQFPD